MKYTERLKLAAAADILYMAVLAIAFVLAERNLMTSYGLFLAVILIGGGICVAASLYTERGTCRKWRRVWKYPAWQTAGYIIAAAALILCLFVFPETEHYGGLLVLLIMVYALIKDIRYYRYAVRYGMDDLDSVNELASKYPEAERMINRKQERV